MTQGNKELATEIIRWEVFMNAGNAARTYETGSRSIKITTLYDLMEEIDTRHQISEGGQTDQQGVNTRISPVAIKVAHMFASGQIRFKNIQDVKRKYADWFI